MILLICETISWRWSKADFKLCGLFKLFFLYFSYRYYERATSNSILVEKKAGPAMSIFAKPFLPLRVSIASWIRLLSQNKKSAFLRFSRSYYSLRLLINDQYSKPAVCRSLIEYFQSIEPVPIAIPWLGLYTKENFLPART